MYVCMYVCYFEYNFQQFILQIEISYRKTITGECTIGQTFLAKSLDCTTGCSGSITNIAVNCTNNIPEIGRTGSMSYIYNPPSTSFEAS